MTEAQGGDEHDRVPAREAPIDGDAIREVPDRVLDLQIPEDLPVGCGTHQAPNGVPRVDQGGRDPATRVSRRPHDQDLHFLPPETTSWSNPA